MVMSKGHIVGDLTYAPGPKPLPEEIKSKLDEAVAIIKMRKQPEWSRLKENQPTIYVVKDGRLELVKTKVAYVKKALRDTN